MVPLAFNGHVSRVVWVKPPWSHQVPHGSYSLPLGVDPATDCVRTSSRLHYYAAGEREGVNIMWQVAQCE